MSRYDTQEGIESYMVDLTHFHLLLRDRRAAYQQDEVHLNEWLWDGRWRLDCFGQVFLITQGSPREVAPEKFVRKVVPWSLAGEHSEFITSTMHYPADPMAGCDRCEVRWTLDNAHDVEELAVRDGKPVYLHEECLGYVRLERAQDIYRKAFAEAGYVKADLQAIPNQYWPRSLSKHGDPWFWVLTEKGRLMVGRRKRVWHIDWAQTTLPDLPAALRKEDVTKGERFIHAWSYPNLVKYLQVLREAA